MTTSEFHQSLLNGGSLGKADKNLVQEFLKHVRYIHGSYDKDADFINLESEIRKNPLNNQQVMNRIFYLALPPSVFIPVATHLKKHNCNENGVHRLIVEKPFGRDSESSKLLDSVLMSHWDESQLYRIDHYLGKEMVKNLLSLRFANTFFNMIWSCHAICNVQITFKEKIGTMGRGGYFDSSGIIRDVMQNHLLQILALTAMEAPVSLSADDVRNEKVKVLQCIAPVGLNETFIGQYAAGDNNLGYKDDETVPSNSITPTFAACVLNIQNERWDGVPFILKCGKALNETKTEIRIQFKDRPRNLFPNILSRNELVIRVQPNES
ncbi:hypothetical protein HMI55_004729, partial [Coelomomyces lativittatus]